ncbi:Adenosine deaminase-related growth factor [Trinorchestia longiramus]|nr:Adenosine deaminase-related growth factor [Trinorchestia longiramus]
MRGAFLILLTALAVSRALPQKTGSRAIDNETYAEQRAALMEQDYASMLGWELTLTEEEEQVNTILKSLKDAEIDKAKATDNFLPAVNFMISKSEIEQSEVFAFIKSMPKGAVLHGHDTGLTSIDFVVQELTYWDHLYMCYEDFGPIFRFSSTVPDTVPCSSGWFLVAEERADASSPEDFDNALYKNLTIVVDNPLEAYPTVDAAWQRFNQYFESIDGIVSYRPAFEAYHTQSLQELLQDGVQYLEFRGAQPLLHELDGTELTPLETIGVYKNISDTFVTINPGDFWGVRYIYGPLRGVSVDVIYDYLDLVKSLKTSFPDYIAGFDLVGQEDPGPPLKTFIEPLLSLQEYEPPIDVFYHAGETEWTVTKLMTKYFEDWYGEDVDENVFDALLLNATRIGHGYAVVKHPAAQQRARATNTPVEVCPISNQVLRLVEDLRNHPGVQLASTSFPMVVSSDDPAPWAALPLSHDIYEAFLAFGGRHADLKFLKQLAINSIEYSSLPAEQKAGLYEMWSGKWNEFINSTLRRYHAISTNLLPEHF